MKIGPKYKIARRLGAPIFEKTQSQKFVLSSERKSRKGGNRQKTDFGMQLNEKQKARFFYGVTEKQFKNYVNEAHDKKAVIPAQELVSLLESRLDNTIWRTGLASTHGAARQMVSHGHITVNGVRSRTPSQRLRVGDKLGIRAGSVTSKLFTEFMEKGLNKELPTWLVYDEKNREFSVTGKPASEGGALMFDPGQIIEFYSR